MPSLTAAAGVLLLAVLSVPFVAAQSSSQCSRDCTPADVNRDGVTRMKPVNVILWAHCDDLVNRCPINVEPPGRGEPDAASGPQTTVPSSDDFPDFLAYISPTRVEFDDGAGPRTSPDTGLARDLRLSRGEAIAYVYASPKIVPDGAAPTLPTVYADGRIETGRVPGGGTLLAAGRSEAVAAPDATAPFEFRIPMRLTNASWPSAATEPGGVIWSVRFFEAEPAQSTGHRSTWEVHTGPVFPTRLILNVSNPLEIVYADFNEFQGDHFIRATGLSPFGSFDLDDGRVRLDIEGPRPIPPEAVRLVSLRRDSGPLGSSVPVNATWRIDFELANAAAGTYSVRAIFPTYQRTYEAVSTLEVEYRPRTTALSPIPGAPAWGLALLLLVPAALARRFA